MQKTLLLLLHHVIDIYKLIHLFQPHNCKYNLKDIIKELVDESKDIENVPITLNFRENNKVGIIGEKSIVNKFYDALMLQIMAYHGYDMLRLVILTNDKNKGYWEKFRNLTYLWNNNKSIRYYGTNKDDINKITSFLMEEYNFRKEMLDENKEMQFIPYYLIIPGKIGSSPFFYPP